MTDQEIKEVEKEIAAININVATLKSQIKFHWMEFIIGLTLGYAVSGTIAIILGAFK